MLIETLHIHQHFADKLGLHPGQLGKFGHLVVLAGPNGCGKSRLLSVLDWSVEQLATMGYAGLERWKAAREKHKPQFSPEYDVHHWASMNFEDTLRAEWIALFGSLGVVFEADEDKEAVLRCFAELNEFMKRQPEGLLAYGARLSIGRVRPARDFSRTGLLASPLSYVKDVSERLIASRRLDEDTSGLLLASYDPVIETLFQDLCAILKDMLALDLKVEGAGISVNAIPIDQLALSDGQQHILRWAVLIHSKVLERLAVPILMDEPELHLHPEALIKLVDLLRVRLPRAQLWIATHSLPLIAHLAASDPRCVWWGEQGRFSKAGGDFAKVSAGLFGGGGGVEALADFCAEPQRFALRSYGAECLLTPGTVPFQAKDAQLLQIWARLCARKGGAPLRILDFGAGQARLLDGLAEQCREHGLAMSAHFSYHAVEIDEDTRKICTANVASYYGVGPARVFASPELALAALKADSVDVIILTNVLHEVPLPRWLPDVFGNAALNSLAAADGIVLIVEDTELGTGELAHEFGYLIMDSAALEVLFGVGAAEKTAGLFQTHRDADPKRGQRLQASVIAAALMARVGAASIHAALLEQKRITMDALRGLRASMLPSRHDYRLGRRHAFLAQHLANLTLALESLPAARFKRPSKRRWLRGAGSPPAGSPTARSSPAIQARTFRSRRSSVRGRK